MTLSLKERTAFHLSSPFSIVFVNWEGEVWPHHCGQGSTFVLPRRTLLQSVLRRVLIGRTVVAARRALPAYPVQIPTETPISGEHLRQVERQSVPPSVRPFRQTELDGTRGPSAHRGWKLATLLSPRDGPAS
jgi:hypothetical protein